MLSQLRWVKKEWDRNHSHHGGAAAFARCAGGSLRLRSLPDIAESIPGRVDAVTFSVVPGMTALWAASMERSLRDTSLNIFVGDCSGGFRPLDRSTHVRTYPLLNALHGPKLDLFLSKLCRGEYVIISDDDVFWLDDAPWRWAMEQFQRDEKTAVVSLLPRAFLSSVLRGKMEHAMGSYCLIVRREIWLKERLSFKIVEPPKNMGYDWVYDTADFANVQLLERAYHIAIAPPEIRERLMILDSTSTWTLKIQENAGKIRDHLLDDPVIRSVKALRTAYALREMYELTQQLYPSEGRGYLVQPGYLQNAEQACREFLPVEKQEQLKGEVKTQMENLRKRIGQLA